MKGFNTSDLQNYAELVSIGRPDFIEVKVVTYFHLLFHPSSFCRIFFVDILMPTVCAAYFCAFFSGTTFQDHFSNVSLFVYLVNGVNWCETVAFAAQGVTYCGESKSSMLTMDNVPWHDEVVDFVQQLARLLQPDYAVASEHAHSNCVLMANTKVKLMAWLNVGLRPADLPCPAPDLGFPG